VVRNLFDRRVLLVTGKGGAGKTTIATALAMAARDRGLKVLLVQLGQGDYLGPIFDRHLPVYRETELEPGLFGMIIEPYLALHEYLVGAMKIQMVVDWFLENRVIQYLTQAAPGWRELITVGKIWQLEQQTVGYQKRPRWDLLVVDAPATGHGITFLRVPQIILNTLKFGPVRQHTLAVQKLLMDPDRTLLIGVTLPEEMAVNEVAEIYHAAKNTLEIPYGATVINGFVSPLADRSTAPLVESLLGDAKAMSSLERTLPQGTAPLRRAMEMRQARAELSVYYKRQVAEKIGGTIMTVPFLAQMNEDRESMRKVAKELDEQIPRGRR
jgi:anion-transporting  ArsA/GET3 family ATPase